MNGSSIDLLCPKSTVEVFSDLTTHSTLNSSPCLSLMILLPLLLMNSKPEWTRMSVIDKRARSITYPGLSSWLFCACFCRAVLGIVSDNGWEQEGGCQSKSQIISDNLRWSQTVSDNLRLNLKGFGVVSSYQIATKLHTDVPIALTTKPVDKNRDK